MWYGSGKVFKPLTIIMDNSIVELGESLNASVMAKAVNLVHKVVESTISVIPVLPDIMGRGFATVGSIKEQYGEWVDQVHAPSGFMMVAQGSDWLDFTACVDAFFIYDRGKYERITWVGIPRKLTEYLGSRKNAVRYVQMVAPQVKIHLLGFSDDIHDDLECAKMGVEGIDSAVPIRYHDALRPLTPPSAIKKRADDWFEKGELTDQHFLNLLNVRKWIAQETF